MIEPLDADSSLVDRRITVGVFLYSESVGGVQDVFWFGAKLVFPVAIVFTSSQLGFEGLSPSWEAKSLLCSLGNGSCNESKPVGSLKG